MNKLPTFITKNNVVLPLWIREITVSKQESVELMKEANEKNNGEFLIIYDLKKSDAYNFTEKKGVLVKILKIVSESGDGNLTVVVEGKKRVKILTDIKDPITKINYSEFEDAKEKIGRRKPISDLREILSGGIRQVKDLPFEIDEEELKKIDKLNNSQFLDRFSSLLPLSNEEVAPLIYISSLDERYIFIARKFSEITEKSLPKEISEVKGDVRKRVSSKIQKQQKEYYLREQIKAAQAELDELVGNDGEIELLRKRVNENPYPDYIKKKALSEIKKLEQTPSQAQEANITRQYIETLLDLPYWQHDKESIDIKGAKKTLDQEHYGLEKPKSRIIEYLAVKQQNPDAKGSILALVGPPGTGKTTMAKSIANTLGRKLIKISLGGVKDEAEIRGHRRTYIASQPGKIIQAMKKSGVVNPIILLDEIDKMSADFKGDPTSAMLEVLDYEQNSSFQDHYLEEEYDLSNVTFIATANYYKDIPEALIDRLDIVEISSYTELEKIEIFKKHLLKKVIDETKIPESLFIWTDDGIKELIRHYTIEAGVRQLFRETNTVARKILVKKMNGEIKNRKKFELNSQVIQDLLGPQRFEYTKIDNIPQIGTVTGLAWTSYGGDILPIEVNIHSGKGDLILTGQLKEVMKESASIAFSYVKSNAEKFGIDVDLLKNLNKKNIHIHSPDGATPKDGPSAGITFTTALISTLSNKPVSNLIGMTGEISLRGNILPIGGLKEKSISAYRSGLKTIFFPKQNIKDLIDIPDEVKGNLEMIPVEKYDEVFERIF